MIKFCTRCDELKDIEMFHKDINKKDGHRAMCKKCWNMLKVDHNKNYSEKSKERKAKKYSITVNDVIVVDELITKYKAIARQEKKKQRDKNKEIERKIKLHTRQIEFENSVMIKHFVCTSCNIDKPITEFYINNRIRRGYEGRCKACESIKGNRYEMSEESKDKKKKYYIKYRSDPNNKERLTHNSRVAHYRRRSILKEDGGHISAKELRVTKEKWNGKCYWCNKRVDNKDIHFDHYVPLSKGGRNIIENIVVACSHCNISKHNNMPEEFAMRRGRLL